MVISLKEAKRSLETVGYAQESFAAICSEECHRILLAAACVFSLSRKWLR